MVRVYKRHLEGDAKSAVEDVIQRGTSLHTAAWCKEVLAGILSKKATEIGLDTCLLYTSRCV